MRHLLETTLKNKLISNYCNFVLSLKGVINFQTANLSDAFKKLQKYFFLLNNGYEMKKVVIVLFKKQFLTYILYFILLKYTNLE